MSQIYKIAYVKKNEIYKLYIFIGNNIKKNNDELKKLFKLNPNDKIFNDIFSKEFADNLHKNNIEIEFLNEVLYIDDNIETIKKKFIKFTNLELSFEELYLFVQQKKLLDTNIIYENINDNGEILKEDIITLLYNIEDIDINVDILESKDSYNFNDLIKLNLDDKEHLINIPLGQEYNDKNMYIVNPYLIDNKLIDIFNKKIPTTNNELLMETGIINENIILLCDALDVIEFNEKYNVNEESLLDLYYPFLIENKITNKEQLLNKRIDLLQITQDKINNENFERKIENINLLNNIYLNKVNNINYVDKGIKKIHIKLQQNNKLNLPLDMIFNLIPATQTVPFIKLNYGNRQDKMYKLYSDNIAMNGSKIPYLNKAIIIKLSKTVGKVKQVGLYIQSNYNRERLEITCEIDNKGSIIIKAEFIKGVTQEYIDDLFKKEVNPILEILKNHLSQSGYNFKLFSSVKNNNVEIINIDYELTLEISKKLNIKKNIGCLSSVFNIINDDIKNDITLRYKRVSNYNEMDSKEIFVLDMLRNDELLEDIEIKYSTNFNIQLENAKSEIKEIISVFQLLEINNRRIKIKNNPGFSIIMSKGKYDNKLNILINGIDNIYYINNIFIYLEALLILTQFPEISNITSNSDYKKLCNTKKIIVEEDLDKVKEIEHDGYYTENDSDDDFSLMSDEDEDEDEDKVEDDVEDKVEDEDEVEDEDKKMFGGNDSPETDDEDLEIDITGKKLRTSKGNIFFDKLNKLEPTLYLQKIDNKKFNQYSRMCPFSDRRQPIILTDKELEKIDKESPGSYKKILKFGSDTNNKYSYICPRYWDIKRNISLTKEQVDSGKYGDIIPDKATIIPEGANIYEFKSKKHIDKDGNYVDYVPGFLDRKNHPKNKCIACCFHNERWNQPAQIKRREECLGSNKEENSEKYLLKKQKKTKKNTDYIMSSTSFPLEQGKYGFIPIQIHNFLQIRGNKCQINYDNKLVTNTKCLLRYGVEFNENQSFISVIAEYWSISRNKKKTISIIKMKEKLLDALDIDNFMTLQNGNLLQLFDANMEVNINDHKETILYKNTNLENPEQLNLLKKVISSYNNFKNYINNDTNIIDYKYLWDLICIPNKKLFPDGLNMVILEFADDDVTNNIKIICPSNHYSKNIFDLKKNTILILKNENIYEPIIQRIDIEKTNTLTDIRRNNFLNNSNSIDNIKEFFKIVKKSFENKCKPSKLKIYNFKNNIILKDMLYILKDIGLKNFKQVINYNGKVIGLLVTNDNKICLIPCLPSAIMVDIDYTYIDKSFAISYEDTKDFLDNIHELSNGNIPCKPSLKVVEDEVIIGIITQTNQFVPVLPEPIFNDDLDTIKDNNHIVIDALSITNETIDEERNVYINKIKIENKLYNVFRNTLRITINDYKNIQIKTDIEKIINSNKILYYTKLKKIEKIIIKLLKNKVTFTEYDDNIINSLTNITNCYVKKNKNCNTPCFYSRKDKNCKLLIPNKNLLNNDDNSKMYYARLSDELVRYNSIRSFILEPKAFLDFTDVKLKLSDNEILLLDSNLNQKYFENLIPVTKNEFIKFNTHDFVEPNL